MAPMTERVCHSRVASPQPMRPGWSVMTFTKIQLRIRALQTRVSISTIFTAGRLGGGLAEVKSPNRGAGGEPGALARDCDKARQRWRNLAPVLPPARAKSGVPAGPAYAG